MLWGLGACTKFATVSLQNNSIHKQLKIKEMNDLISKEETGAKGQASTVTGAADNEKFNGLFDFISSALPTIGKVAMNVFSSFANDGTKVGCYTALSEGQGEEDETGLHFINENGRLMAVNTSLSKSYAVNIPAKGNEPILNAVLKPFSKLDMTEDMRNASNANIQRFSVLGMPKASSAGLTNLGEGVISCLAYVTKGILKIGKKLNAHLTLKAVNDDLQIILSVDLKPVSVQSVTISALNGGEQKRFNFVGAMPIESASNDTEYRIVLKDALKGFQEDDDLEIVGDVAFENVSGKCVVDKTGTFLTEEDAHNFLSIIRR